MTDDALSEMLVNRIPVLFSVCVCVCLPVCCLSLQTKGRLGLRHQISIHLQFFHQPGKPDFQVSHPHALDCCPLTCANMSEMERGRAGKSEMEKKISRPLVTGWGAVKNTAQLSKLRQPLDFTCTLFTFRLSVFSLNPFSLSVTGPIVIVG